MSGGGGALLSGRAHTAPDAGGAALFLCAAQRSGRRDAARAVVCALGRFNAHACARQALMKAHTRSVTLRLAQDPSSENLGTTVWDASIVMAKYFEKVCAL